MGLDVLQVITDTDRRGAQVFAMDLGDALARRGWPIRTAALTDGPTGGLDVPVLGSKAVSLETLRSLRTEARKASVVVAHGSTTLPVCAVATLGTGVPFVYRQISDSRFWASTPLRRARVAVGLRRAARVVALWPGSKRVLVEHFFVPDNKITVIPNGVPAGLFARIEEGGKGRDILASVGLEPARFTALYAGALVQEKGVDLAIEAIADLHDVQLLVVGDGPERDRLEEQARRSVPDRVRFLGSIDDMADAYAAADVLVLPSRGGDSMPAVLIEAGLMGRPAISTPIDAIPEIVLDGNTGVLVPIGDARALGAALESLARDPIRTEMLGAATRDHCGARFEIEQVAGSWAAVLDDVCLKRPSSGVSPS